MSSLLLEELSEVKSIYRAINERLSKANKVMELREIVNAIKTEIAKCIDLLEDIERNIVKALEVFSRIDKGRFNVLYVQISRIVDRMRHRALVLNRLVNIINLCIHLWCNDDYRNSLMMLQQIISNVKKLLGSTLGINMYILVEHHYLMLNILKKYNVVVLCIPSYDLLKPWKWVLLFHELGHLLFDINREMFVREFRHRIMPLLKQSALTNVGEHTNVILRTWEQYWLEEFVSDLYGVALGGPAYTYAFVIEAFSSDIFACTETHPSLDLRMHLQLKYLDRIEEVKELASNVRRLWYLHRQSIAAAKDLYYPFTSRVFDELIEIFMSVVKRPSFLSFLHEVVTLRERIDRGEVVKANPLYLILALVLSSRRRDEEIQKRIIKTLSGDEG